MKDLVWTRKKPTKDGWYWYRHEGKQPIVGRVLCGGVFWAGQYFRVEDLADEWAGPIPEPKQKGDTE